MDSWTFSAVLMAVVTGISGNFLYDRLPPLLERFAHLLVERRVAAVRKRVLSAATRITNEAEHFRPKTQASTSAQTLPGRRLHDWLEPIGFFIPHTVREPFWNHVLEDHDRMVNEGHSRWFVRLAIDTQFTWLLVLGLKDVLVQFVPGIAKTPRP